MKFLLPLLLMTLLAPAPARAEVNLEWGQATRSWRLVEFTDVNGTTRRLWYHTSQEALGDQLPLFAVSDNDGVARTAENTSYEWFKPGVVKRGDIP